MAACIDHGLKGNAQGYGRYWAPDLGKKELAHRNVFRMHHDYLPQVVMHTCDNPRCVNINHLTAGDWATNNKDRAAKGRSAPIRLDLRKLNDAQAADIRRRWSLKVGKIDRVNGVSALAKDFGVDSNTIYNIVKGKSHFYVQ